MHKILLGIMSCIRIVSVYRNGLGCLGDGVHAGKWVTLDVVGMLVQM